MLYRSNYHILEVCGADALRYLQGRCTQDLSTLAPGNALPSLLLSPQGKVQGKFIVARYDEGFYLFLSSLSDTERDEFIQNLLRFKVADDVQVTQVSEELHLFISEESSPNPHSDTSSYTYSTSVVTEGALCVSYAFGAKDEVMYSGKEITDDEFEFLRIQAGIPLFNKDVSEKNIASDLLLSTYVSFSKGCYSGQEVVEMSTARGRPNKIFFTGVLSENVSAAEIPLDVYESDSKESSVIGKITSVSSRGETVVCLGFMLSKFSLDSGFVLTEDASPVSLKGKLYPNVTQE